MHAILQKHRTRKKEENQEGVTPEFSFRNISRRRERT